MKRLYILLMLLSFTCLIAGNTFAVTLSYEPSAQSISLGDPASIDLNISGLGDFAAPSLGAFLVEVTFDDSVLAFNSVTYGPFLGDPLDPLETDIMTTAAPGMVSLDEFSFLFDFELDALQPDSFTLASLSFTGDNVGVSNLGFGLIDLSDAVGSTIVDPLLEPGSIRVSPAQAPEPSILFLLVSGMAGFAFWSRRQGSR